MLEILIPPISDEEKSDQVRGLLEGLRGAGLLQMSICILVTTEDAQVAELAGRFGRRLDDGRRLDATPGVETVRPVDVVPDVVPEKKSRKGIGGRKKQKAPDERPQTKTVDGQVMFTDPATGQEVSWGSIRQGIRFGKYVLGKHFTNSQGETVVLRQGKKGQTTLVKLGVAEPPPTPQPVEPIPAALAQDLRAIVQEAGRKAINGDRGRNGGEAHGDLPAVEGATVYTSLVTGEKIPNGEMQTLLRTRRVNAKERFISNRHGLMEVYDKGPGKKLVLHKVDEP